MLNQDSSVRMLTFVGPAVVLGALLYLLPVDALAVLTVWTVLSFPIGMLVGHCVLSER